MKIRSIVTRLAIAAGKTVFCEQVDNHIVVMFKTRRTQDEELIATIRDQLAKFKVNPVITYKRRQHELGHVYTVACIAVPRHKVIDDYALNATLCREFNAFLLDWQQRHQYNVVTA